jgi:ribosomal protein S6--L-glutamate ligase|tara:strand:- start:4373 stop:5947 length:1575 start_codon:yes stop_codon:yes gene_type:complete
MAKKDKVVLILTDKNLNTKDGLFETSAGIKEDLDGMNITNFVLFTNNALLTKNEDGTVTANNPGGKEFTFNPANTSALMRNSAINTTHGEDVVEDLEDYGVYVVNNLKSTKLVNDKHKFSKLLLRKGISTPATKLIPDEDSLDNVINDFEFPAVFKTLKGSKGVGVFKIDKRSSAKGVLQALWNQGEDLLIQELIKNDGDVRTIVIGNKIIGAMKRISDGKDFRNNVSQGAAIEPYELNPKEKKEILKAARVSGCDICGVDHILAADGKIYILEVNSSPGTKGFKEIDEDIVSKMATYIASKHSENPTESILGHKENVEIDKIGTFLSKLDTGNGRYSVLHGDNIKVHNDIVTFEVDNKTFEFPLEEIAKVKTGAVSSTIEKRPVIKLNTKLNGKTLKNEPFFITDRSDKTTPALLSRALLQRARVIIDPSKKHTMKESTRYKGVAGYLKEEKKVTIKELSDTALVMLSVLAVGSALPAVIDKNINKELKNNNFISKSNKVTPSGMQYLKQPRMIVRLSKIGSR